MKSSSNPPPNWLTARQVGTAVIAKLPPGDLFHDEAIDRLGDELVRLIEETNCRRLVIDFSAVAHVASDLLAVLLVAHKRLVQKDGRLVLCSLNDNLRQLFSTLQLDKLFRIVLDEHEALKDAHA